MTLIEDPETPNYLDAKVGDLAFNIGGFPHGMHEDSFMDFVEEYDLCNSHYVDQLDSYLAASPFQDHIRIHAKDKSIQNPSSIRDFLEQHRNLIIIEG